MTLIDIVRLFTFYGDNVRRCFVFVELGRALQTYRKFSGRRIVSCPETHRAATVQVAAGKAAWEAVVGSDEVRLSACSRWPEKQDCGQECLRQIEDAPEACLVWTIINHWYQGQECVYCHKPFTEIHWHDHPPALRDKSGKTFQSSGVPAESLQEIFATHSPVCWNCHIAETFRREHRETVVDRNDDSRRMTLYH